SSQWCSRLVASVNRASLSNLNCKVSIKQRSSLPNPDTPPTQQQRINKLPIGQESKQPCAQNTSLLTSRQNKLHTNSHFECHQSPIYRHEMPSLHGSTALGEHRKGSILGEMTRQNTHLPAELCSLFRR